MSQKWRDVSVPLRSGMVHWPGDPRVVVRRISSIEEGARSNVSALRMSAHTGTHVDAPLHFLKDGRSLDQLPLDGLIGPARVLAIGHPRWITVEELRPYRIRRGDRLLFKTRGAKRRWRKSEFDPAYVYIPKETAEFLVERRVRLVGMDYLSVGGYRRDSLETHQILLRGGVWIVEGLDLSRITPGRYDLICLPLKIQGGDGAPARAALRPRD